MCRLAPAVICRGVLSSTRQLLLLWLVIEWYTGVEHLYACRARQIEDQNRQLAGHADRVEQQQADMALQLRELTKRLQQTAAENEQLSEEIRSLRKAVQVIIFPCIND